MREYLTFALRRVRPEESLIADERSATHAGAVTVRLVTGQVRYAITERIGGREHSARARPHAVVADFESHVGGEDVERSPAVGCEVVLRLDVQDVVPLREVHVVGPGEVFAHRANRFFEVAVDLETAILEVEGFRARRQRSQRCDDHDREGASKQRELEMRTHASRRHRGHGPSWRPTRRPTATARRPQARQPIALTLRTGLPATRFEKRLGFPPVTNAPQAVGEDRLSFVYGRERAQTSSPLASVLL
ncbi:MAG: hypothetical protein H6Q91_3105 [Deltaproteobacteria bacterium]|nr:hypothetical protein [Deltaproteobacteria bacterium]